MIRTSKVMFVTQQGRWNCCWMSTTKTTTTTAAAMIPTGLQSSFQVPLTLVDVHLRHEQLPFGYFFHERLDEDQLRASLERVLCRYPVLGGTLAAATKTSAAATSTTIPSIQCRPGDAVPFQTRSCAMTMQQWRRTQPKQHLVRAGHQPKLLPLFDCLMTTDTDENNISSNHHLASVTVTYFDCGGTALGVNMNHAVADAASCLRFVASWGREMRGLPPPPTNVSNERWAATCSGMISPELADVLLLGSCWNSSSSPSSSNSSSMSNNEDSFHSDPHEYIILKFPPNVLQAMKAYGMASCLQDRNSNNSNDIDYYSSLPPPPDFVSTNDMVTAMGWLLKRQLSGMDDWNMSMVVNLRGRAGVDDFCCEQTDGVTAQATDGGGGGVFGNGITNIVATMPPSIDANTNKIGLADIGAAARTIRLALTNGLKGMSDRVTRSRMGKACIPASGGASFATTSWQQFPLWDIAFTDHQSLAGFHGHPLHPLPVGRDTFSSVIVPQKCGGFTYQLLAPSCKHQVATVFHEELCSLFLEWHSKLHTE